MSRKRKTTHVRLPVEVADRLRRIAAEMMDSYVKGYTTRIDLVENGSSVFVPLHAVITKALDELEDHRRRSNRKEAV